LSVVHLLFSLAAQDYPLHCQDQLSDEHDLSSSNTRKPGSPAFLSIQAGCQDNMASLDYVVRAAAYDNAEPSWHDLPLT
jgi:hypothetical protein